MNPPKPIIYCSGNLVDKELHDEKAKKYGLICNSRQIYFSEYDVRLWARQLADKIDELECTCILEEEQSPCELYKMKQVLVKELLLVAGDENGK